MITFKEIEGIPDNHPKVIQFEEEQLDLYKCLSESNGLSTLDDEAGIDFFDRYIAGDR